MENSNANRSENEFFLDVRTLPHARRHEAIFSLLERLEVGQRLTITNDHDPAPLGYQLRALYGEKYGWEYVERGPERWRVAIPRKA